jgi:Polyketide cyclase / dehydrase and lipid transport
VHAAVLAANAHNSQPWRFDLSDCGIGVMEDTVMPVEDYTAEFAIEGRDGGSTVRWSARFEVSDENDRETAEAVRRFLRTGLDALQTKV